MDARERVKFLQDMVSHLVSIRRPWAEVWNDVRAVVRPSRRWETNSLRPKKTEVADIISPHIMDNKAGRAYRTLAAGLHSGLTPPSSAWFTLRVEDDDLMEYGPVKTWLDTVERILYSAFARSNFYPSMHSVYNDLSVNCSGSLGIQGRSGIGMVFSDMPVGSFAWGGDANGKIHTIARYVGMTAGELVREYGWEKVSPATKRMAEKEPYKEVPCIHVAMPRDYADREPGKIDRRNKPVASYFYEDETGHLVNEGGFDNFPYLGVRWDVSSGELYGRGVGFDVLPDVRMLQAISKDQALGIRMNALPPLKVPAGLKDRVLLVPGAKIYVNPNEASIIEPILRVQPDVAAISAKVADLRRAVEEGYFNDIFLLLAKADKSKTAYEVAQLNSEKLLILGPVIERQQTDILDPCISGTYMALDAMGAIPPAPEEIAGMGMDISFISILAQAQKITRATATRNIVNDVAGMAQIDPSVVDKVDFDQVVDELAKIEGVPPNVVRTDDVVAEIRKRRAEEQAQQQQMQMMQEMNNQALAGVETLGNANTEQGTALGDLMSAFTGGGAQ